MNKNSQNGVALIMVIWILTILTVIVLSFSFMARTETYSTLSFKEGLEKKFFAEAGIQRGITELFYRDLYETQNIEFEGTEVWKTDGSPYKGQIGSGYYTVRITDESGKVDINTASDVVLKNLLFNLGVTVEEADIIVDSIMDWKDADDLYRLHGAEDDYYMSLKHPYRAKNADFETLEELILVRGITPEILYGTAEKKGLIDFITINSKTNTININAAPKEVLVSIPGITNEMADFIIEYRENKEIENLEEIHDILGENFSIVSPYVSTTGTNTFTIDSVGKKEDKKGGYGIRAIIQITGINEYSYLYYKSPANIRQ